jgi:hypothetical protein
MTEAAALEGAAMRLLLTSTQQRAQPEPFPSARAKYFSRFLRIFSLQQNFAPLLLAAETFPELGRCPRISCDFLRAPARGAAPDDLFFNAMKFLLACDS